MKNEQRPAATRITITTGSLLRIIGVLALAYIAFLIKDILALLFVSIILASAMNPWVDWITDKGIPRVLSVVIIYIVGLSLVSGFLWLSIPPVIEQSTQLATDFPVYLETISGYAESLKEFSDSHIWFNNVAEGISSIFTNLPAGENILSSIFGFFGGVLSFFIIIVITFYMMVEQNSIKKLIWSLTPAKHQTYAMDVLRRMQHKMGLWFRGQLVLCFAIFLLTYISLSILGVKYAFILALIAGLTELIPYLGPVIGAVPAVLIALTQSPALALGVIIVYLIIQQVENAFLVPKIMQKAVGLNPIASIVVIMIGFSIGGILGALLAIPAATAGTVILEDIFNKKHALSMSAMED